MVTWSRSNLKNRAKETMHRSYWKMVLVGFIVLLVGGGLSGGSSSGIRSITDSITDGLTNERISTEHYDDFDYDDYNDNNEFTDEWKSELDDFSHSFGGFDKTSLAAISVVLIAFLVIMLIVFVITTALQIFLINPFMVGAKRFFSHSLVEDANLRELTYAYEHNYLNQVKNIFLMNLFIGLWSLLFVIPGIVKKYEYLMIPYLLGEHPEMSTKEAFAKSREMMYGQKWSAFVLDLSFIGWWILTGITCGLVGIFWTTPYHSLTFAALYRELSGVDRYGYQDSPESNFSQNGQFQQDTIIDPQNNATNQSNGYDQGYFSNQNDTTEQSTPVDQNYDQDPEDYDNQ